MFFFLRRRRLSACKPQSSGRKAAVVMAWMALVVALHVAAMVSFEGLSAFEGLWLTMTTVFTVGYGDLAAKTVEGRVATMVLGYGGGVFFLANLASLFIEASSEAKRKGLLGLGGWKMKGHVVILGSPATGAESFLSSLIGQLVQSEKTPVHEFAIVSRSFPNGLPDSLIDQGAVLVNGWGGDPDSLERASARDAAVALVLSKTEDDPASDSFSLDCVMRLREMGFSGRIVSECVKGYNRARLEAAGANEVIRPVRAYPEMTARSITSPGSTVIFEELFDVSGAEMVREDLSAVDVRPWGEYCKERMSLDGAIPCGYLPTGGGRPVCAPKAADTTPRSAVFMIVGG